MPWESGSSSSSSSVSKNRCREEEEEGGVEGVHGSDQYHGRFGVKESTKETDLAVVFSSIFCLHGFEIERCEREDFPFPLLL